MGWKHSASTMTLLWKRITHSPARLTLRFVGVNCMAESNECTGVPSLRHTHTRAHTYTRIHPDTRGKIYDRLETRTDARRGNRILQFACIICNFSRRISRFHDQNKRFILTFMRRLMRCLGTANGAENGVYRYGCSVYIREYSEHMKKLTTG